MDLTQLVPVIAKALGMAPSTLLLLIGAIITASNLTGRLIPDDKTGILGAIRMVCKFIGIYASNRITSGVSTNDVARSVAGVSQEPTKDEVLRDLAADTAALIPQVVDERADVVPAFPGLKAQGLMSEPQPDPIRAIEEARAENEPPTPPRKRPSRAKTTGTE